ncbi:MAG: hypothetical protein HVN35_11180 [Methanobacteriaceae archaeon]|nr:hypothetical protein [Methanobacteriaceae archaeon]
MKVTKGLVPIDKGVNEIRVLHSKPFDKDELIRKSVKMNKKVTIHKANGEVVKIN